MFAALLLILLTQVSKETVEGVTKFVGFTKSDCNVYRYYLHSESESYEVQWDGDPIPKYYCVLRFKMMSADKYRLCADVTYFNLQSDCDVTLKFYWGVYMNPKTYKCTSRIPIQYCDDENVFIELVPSSYDTRYPSMSLRIRVSAILVSDESEASASSPVGVVAGAVVGVLIVVVFGFVAIKICRKKQSSMGSSNVRYPGTNVQRQDGTVQVSLTNTNNNPSDGQQNQHTNQQGLMQNRYADGRSSPYAGYPPNQYSDGRSSPYAGYPQNQYSDGRSSPYAGYPQNQYSDGRSSPYNYSANPQQSYGRDPQHTFPSTDTSAPPPPYHEVVGKK